MPTKLQMESGIAKMLGHNIIAESHASYVLVITMGILSTVNLQPEVSKLFGQLKNNSDRLNLT